MTTKRERVELGIPPRPFLYTLDQIATLTGYEYAALRRDVVHYDGRSIGFRPRKKMLARNIADDGVKPEWRVAEAELFRWLRICGFRIHERGWIRD